MKNINRQNAICSQGVTVKLKLEMYAKFSINVIMQLEKLITNDTFKSKFIINLTSQTTIYSQCIHVEKHLGRDRCSFIIFGSFEAVFQTFLGSSYNMLFYGPPKAPFQYE